MVALVTARARVPAMAGVGGPAAGRVARRRRDLLRSSASRGAVTSKPLRPVEKFGTRFEGLEAVLEAPAFVLPNLGRQTGRHTDRRTDKSNIVLHRKFLSFRARANFTLAVNL